MLHSSISWLNLAMILSFEVTHKVVVRKWLVLESKAWLSWISKLTSSLTWLWCFNHDNWNGRDWLGILLPPCGLFVEVLGCLIAGRSQWWLNLHGSWLSPEHVFPRTNVTSSSFLRPTLHHFFHILLDTHASLDSMWGGAGQEHES